MTTLYGIPNCDTVRKARKWMDQRGLDYDFHDFREDGLDEKALGTWADSCGWQSLLNKRSTSFRNLSDEDKRVTERDHAVRLMLDNPTLIKRPIMTHGQTVLVGFNESEWENTLC